ncbi:hypothetical protein ABK040_002647 [Willaertia magna]
MSVNKLVYFLLVEFLEFCISLFYERVSVKGSTSIPDKGPVIFCGNHHNGLVDPLFIYTKVKKRKVRGVAAGYLFKLPLLGYFLRLLGTIPVIRQQDVTKDEEEQRKTNSQAAIDAMAKVLLDGDALVIFPEGISHNNSDIQTVKTGFARAAFTALLSNENLPFVSVVPVGLNYDDKNRFRSNVFVQYGKPIKIDRDLLSEYKKDPDRVLHELAETLRKALQDVTIIAKDNETISIAHLARSMFRRKDENITQEEYLLLTRRFIDLFENVGEARSVFDKLRSFQISLRVLNIDFKELKNRQSILLDIIKLIFTIPFALPGSLYHGPLGLLSRFIGKKLAEGYKDQEAHYKIMVVLILLPIQYILTLILLSLFFGVYTSMLIMLLLAVSGYIAVNTRPLTHGWHLIKTNGKLLLVNREELSRLQKEIQKELSPLVSKYMEDLSSIIDRTTLIQ